MHPPSTRAAALDRLRAFAPCVAAYTADRNHVMPGHPNVSCLSPAIRHRLVLEEEVIAAAREAHRPHACAKFVEEVLWRTYWKGWLEQRSGVWVSYVRGVERHRSSLPLSVLRRVEAVAAGQSGVAVMDAFARELIDTGFMHNHARMWWASFWIHVERLPWELGAAHFMRHLLDADPASNTLSWRWVAGLHTKGKAYLVRRSNIESFLSPELRRDRTGLDQLDDACVEAADLTDDADVTRHPIESLGGEVSPSGRRVGLWLHEDDLVPEVGELAACRPVAVGGWLEQGDGAASQRSHRLAALNDGRARASAHFGCEATGGEATSMAEAMAAWIAEKGLDQVVAFAPFAGPLGDSLPTVAKAAAAAGARLTLMRRAWDRRLFPLSTGGFFGFREKAMGLLNARG
jgi:deoxyribodipyrimidine photo-lyase